jgi:hypothetical protein
LKFFEESPTPTSAMGTVELSKRDKKGKASVTVANIFASMLADVFNSNVANLNVHLPG